MIYNFIRSYCKFDAWKEELRTIYSLAEPENKMRWAYPLLGAHNSNSLDFFFVFSSKLFFNND